MDNAGCKLSCILGSFFLTLSRLLIPLTTIKSHIFILGTTLYPLGLSLYIPALTFAIKKTTLGPMRSLAFSMFYASLTFGVFIGGPSIDYFRSNINNVEVSFAGMTTTLSAYGMLYLAGFILTLFCFLLFFFFYKEIDLEEDSGINERAVISNTGICQIYKDVLGDIKFWKYLFFAILTIGMKLVYVELSIMFPKILVEEFGQSTLYGMILAISPIFICAWLFLTSPCTINLDPFSQIVMGAFFNTFAPIPLLFGMTYFHIFIFIVFVSLGEALNAPKLYEFVFHFTRKGREGMFLTLTAAPHYLTMAVSGLLSGYLLEEFFPDSGEKRLNLIWITLIASSAISLVLLIAFRKCFRP